MSLYQIENLSENVVLVFGTSYKNPIAQLSRIERDLSNFHGKVIFDLMLCNGMESSNRLVAGNVDKGALDRRSMKVLSQSSLNEYAMDKIDQFYENNYSLIDTSNILTEDQKWKFLASGSSFHR